MKKLFLTLVFATFLGLSNVAIAQDNVTLSKEEYAAFQELLKGKKMRRQYTAVRGFEHSVELGFSCEKMLMSGISVVFPGIPYLGYTAGYRFNDYLFVGGGIGFLYDWQAEGNSLPEYSFSAEGYNHSVYQYPFNSFIYANAKTYFTKTLASPFFSVDLGARISKNPGVLFSPAFGVEFKINEKLGMYVKMGYSLNSQKRYDIQVYYNSYRNYSDIYGNNIGHYTEEQAKEMAYKDMIDSGTYLDLIHGFTFRIGVTFGHSTLKKVAK